jgi:hypothetical protein
MKNALFMLSILCGVAVVNADMPSNTIGVRLGAGNGSNLEVSYQRSMSPANRLELDLGWAGFGDDSWIGLSGIYQWWWNITDGLNWYAGPGAQLGFFSGNESGITLAAGGQVGLEYDFSKAGAPVQLSLDIRPLFGFINHSGFGYDGAFSIRYTF